MANIFWRRKITRKPKVFNTIACGRDLAGNTLLLTCEANGKIIPEGMPGQRQEGRWVCLVKLSPQDKIISWEPVTPESERWKPVSGYTEMMGQSLIIVGTISGMDGQGDDVVGIAV